MTTATKRQVEEASREYRDHSGKSAPLRSPEGSKLYLASFGQRLMAWGIDHVIIFPIVALVTIAYFELFAVMPTLFEQLRFAVILFYAIDILYNTVATWLFGATIGKEVLGLRTITEKGSAVSLGVAIKREVVGKLLCQVTLLYGFVMVARDEEARGLHDRIAGTRVIEEAS